MAPIEIARSTLLGLQHCLHLRKVWSWHLLLPMLYHQDIGVKWCGVQCLGVLAGAGDTLTTSLIEQLMTPEDAAKASLDWQDVCATIALHHTVTFDVESIPDGAAIQNQENIHATMVNNAALVPNNYVDVCGILLPHRTYGHETKIKVEKFVLTSTMERSLRSVALALSCEQALLLEGPPSCGKSALITHVAAKTGNLSDMIQVHLDEQTDSKTLVGSYVCTEKPGEFMWQPGPVTLAVTQGSWLVFENLNMASAEVLAMLIPLAERRKLHIPSRSEDLIAASGFQFIATVTADPGLSGTGAYGNSTVIKDLMGAVLHTVTLNESSLEEKREIIKELYPRTAPLCVYAMRALDIMHGSRQHRGKENSKSVMPRRSYTGSDDSIALVINPPVGRYFCFRDLLKWSCRMATIHGDLITRALSPILKCGGDVDLVDIPIDVRLAALIETIDCFCAGISKEDIFDLVLNAMAAIWSVPLSTIHPLVHLAKPDLKIEANSLLVGRAALSRLNKTDAYKHRKSFVFTGHASRIMERVAAATSMGESVLLVGETGTGKTSIVQEIASRIGAKLVVINVSRQTDATDLIGGYRPIRPQDTFIDLLNRFVELVRDTWKRGNNDSFIEKVTKLARKCRWQQLLKLFRNAIDKVNEDHDASRARGEGKSSKRQRRLQNSFDILIHEQWQKFSKDCDSAESIAAAAQSGFAFGFFEGALVQAVKSGWWLLLDEINLAPPETLERINGLLETNGSLTVIERGDRDVVDRHPDFRLFAAMNPSTDAGKRELPSTFRGRFTELWVGEATHRNDLASIVAGQLHSTFAKPPIEDIVDFYLAAKAAGVRKSN